MKKWRLREISWSLLAGLVVGLVSLMLTVHLVSAAPPQQTDDTTSDDTVEQQDTKDCQECHLDVASHWEKSPHAHAFDDEIFQEKWLGMGEPGECLACHTTNYMASTGEYTAEGVECEACHGKVTTNHPPEPIPIKADTQFCGECHTTTLGEWRLTGHATADVGCMDCHDPHSQEALFEVADDMCINCHEESMEAYLEDLHVQNGIGCVDCHALVIPPDPIPDDGIVPTGHAFNITTSTCIACHTDALHAGFSLPGYEHGAKAGNSNGTGEEAEVVSTVLAEPEVEEGLTAEQQVQALEARLGSQNVTLLFQGAVIGLALGGTTAWFVAHNIRARREEDEHGESK
jgi:predicted CXXCH cytochrome family protein